MHKSILLSLTATVLLQASPLDHLRPIEKKEQVNPIEAIDFIYMINLDQRPEKFRYATSQLKRYGIAPCRFPAIYGWGLPVKTLNDIGLKFMPGMMENQWAIEYVEDNGLHANPYFLNDSCVGKTLFSSWISPGAIGCTMSHLSVLKDAMDSKYETIWILEDDIDVVQSPLVLTDLIKELDRLTGKDGWDILYTDLDVKNGDLYDFRNDFESELKGTLWYLWRPDCINANDMSFRKREYVSEDFIRLGSRMRTHSMIIRRSGMKKILDYEAKHGIFIPYDHELSMIPGIKLYSVKYPIVTFLSGISDTISQHFTDE